MIYTNRPMFLAFRHAYSHGDTYSPRPMKNWYWSYWAGNDGALCWKILKSAAENKEPYHFAGYPIRVRYLSVSHYPNVILQDIFMWSIGNIYIYNMSFHAIISISIPICCIISNYIPWYSSRWTKYSNPAARTMLNPRTPKSQCFSARVTKSDVRGLIFSSIGANAFQVTLTLNFGGKGVVPERRGLNISSIYGISN